MKHPRPVSKVKGVAKSLARISPDDINLEGMRSALPGKLEFNDKTGEFEWAGGAKIVRRGKRSKKSKKSKKRTKKRNSKKSKRRR